MNKEAFSRTLAKFAAHASVPNDEGGRIASELEELFTTKEGLAHNAKKELARYFDLTDDKYQLKAHTLREKVAQVLR